MCQDCVQVVERECARVCHGLSGKLGLWPSFSPGEWCQFRESCVCFGTKSVTTLPETAVLPERGERCVKKSSKNFTTVGLLRTVGWHICHHVPYVGLGPGAHGFSPLDASRQWNEPAAFDRALDSGDLQAVPGSERLRIPESRFFVSDSIISSLV